MKKQECNKNRDYNYIVSDVVIVGSGCSALYCALNLPEDKNIVIITKAKLEENDSFLAQGGMCMLKDESDYDNYFEDTMKAGHYENDKKTVDIMIRSSVDVVKDLVDYGVDFQRDENGNFVYTKEGAHSDKRILYHKDITGKEITSKLLAKVMEKKNIKLYEQINMLDILEEDGVCVGVIGVKDDEYYVINANVTVLATGGVGGLFRHSTNYKHLTGDSLAVAIRHNIELKDVNYIQIHPTTLYSETGKRRSFLISESVRGEGAKLYDKDGKRFVNELLPRDLLAEAIYKQMEKDGTNFVWEDLRPIPVKELEEHFPNIVKKCLDAGFDVTKECIPVVPAQHYFMGGIKVNYESKTSMDKLYAVGETACNGVHGKNRLASNSLLESLVFAKRAAYDMIPALDAGKIQYCDVDISKYKDAEAFDKENKQLVKEAIDAANKKMGIVSKIPFRNL